MINVHYIREDDDNFEALVLNDDASEDSIEIQRSLAYDEQDRLNGMDTYCLVRAGSAVAYGGLSAWSIATSVLSLHLSPTTAEVLELPEQVDLPLSAAGQAVIEQHLGRIVGTGSVGRTL